MGGGSLSLWEGYKETVSFYSYGGLERRIEYLKKYIFPDWQDPEKWYGSYVYTVGEWDSSHFSKAVQENDIKRLREIVGILGSGWFFWVFLPLLSLVIAVITPLFLVVYAILIPLGFFTRRSPPI